jgi:hypothetical protein
VINNGILFDGAMKARVRGDPQLGITHAKANISAVAYVGAPKMRIRQNQPISTFKSTYFFDVVLAIPRASRVTGGRVPRGRTHEPMEPRAFHALRVSQSRPGLFAVLGIWALHCPSAQYARTGALGRCLGVEDWKVLDRTPRTGGGPP